MKKEGDALDKLMKEVGKKIDNLAKLGKADGMFMAMIKMMSMMQKQQNEQMKQMMKMLK
ncbi:MAG TPA: hypothetical protein PKC84_14545 [Paracoccaceae bacterium]|nr:hypothetical protein [Paracoccaceae bacterium]